ncbi:helix-turn-helix transcriptional regulator [Acaryochloris sp. IP29b_bin.137]|uniref:PadR family transcriptional regulator n=1 Tax=Acaryochloris sp. IP29b_bin.137 TaxID=2969217 RepID=UPI00260F06D8|nr:helix-turn-helix transcriptional regulator [Acaryochloris sp. IP29b_bin.137]
MNVQDIYQYFKNPPPIYITKEVAVCYILSVLLEEGDSYGTALLKYIRANHPPYRISDTVLYAALNFLIDEAMLSGYWQNESGRGRPRRMYQVADGREEDAQQLAQLWHNFLGKSGEPLKSLVLN